MKQIEHGLRRAFQWVEQQIATDTKLELLADETFFYHMLLNRQDVHDPVWREAIHARLCAAQDIRVQWDAPIVSLQQRMALCQYIDSALMVASLMRVYQPDLPGNEIWIQQVLSQVRTHTEAICGFSFLYDIFYSYFLSALGVSVPKEAVTTETYQGLPPTRKFIVESYYLTHILLLDSHFFQRRLVLCANYKRVFAHICTHVETVKRLGYYDLLGEFIWCYALCGLHDDPLFSQMVDHLLTHQEDDGSWQPWKTFPYDEREKRHAQYVAILALLEAKDAQTR